MIIMVMTFFTIVLAERITDTVIGSRNGMDNSLVQKYLKGAVNRYPVELLAGSLLNITMRQRSLLTKEKFKDPLPAAGYTELVTFENIQYGFFHMGLLRIVIE